MEFEPFGGFGMFGIMSFIVPVFFIFVFSVIIFTIVKGISQWNYNNHQPVLTVDAKVITKRTHTSRHHHANDTVSHSSSTSYYVTFEVESGDRMEFHVPDREFGLLAEGDLGKLTFQGTRYHRFDRIRD